ncbi:polynucleotide adenylyltransferase [Coraliomargarita sinensis]|uniref:Polynucleotide adenylyltransferase n=1 Tax=Coraliomargarita sinensis TaxID=2174842 RepID=A0A317ZNM4_9BACT|nr:polynucleotide adenylyltransferase [Coraliomargarita sinensis]
MQSHGGRAHLVGGCVRDALLGIQAKDIDMEVYGLAVDAVEAALKPYFRLDTVGRSFGVLILKGEGIDLALPRRESKTGPRHTDFKVEGDPDMSPEEAASRRDFTINAICCDPLTGEIIDPFDGVADLKTRTLRHVSAAFSEDPLRVLRGMQFVARFQLKADSGTVELCRELNPADLPAERLWEEWKKLILKGQSLSAGLNFLKDCDWLQHFPELDALVGCEQDPKWHPEGDVWVHTLHCLDAYAAERIGDEWEDLVVGLAVLCHDFGKPDTSYTDDTGRIRSPRHDVEGVPVAKAFLERLTRQKKIFEEVLPLVEQHMRPLALYRDGAGDSAVRRLAARVKRVDRLVRVAHADKSGRPPIQPDSFPEGKWLLEKSKQLAIQDNAPKPILLGRHLIELDIKPGPHFGKILDRAYEAQLDGAFDNEDSGRAYLRKLVREIL